MLRARSLVARVEVVSASTRYFVWGRGVARKGRREPRVRNALSSRRTGGRGGCRSLARARVVREDESKDKTRRRGGDAVVLLRGGGADKRVCLEGGEGGVASDRTTIDDRRSTIDDRRSTTDNRRPPNRVESNRGEVRRGEARRGEASGGKARRVAARVVARVLVDVGAVVALNVRVLGRGATKMANSCRASASGEQGLPFEPERREPRRRRRRAEHIGERARARVADVAVAE